MQEKSWLFLDSLFKFWEYANQNCVFNIENKNLPFLQLLMGE